ncbi:hypothetical protein EOA79_20280 [Mesorhizobium sp. M1A.F.Ca.IN.020.03.2.1]|uniref:hypothetical protein n=1 Tax=Mesorhizobium sp. M1A.F.Ca.IN.020.03.2.1 TaxID=2496769 RepID=UPI000FD1B576|nr:hypothetical protein [Mesorhizobium sp. M1A.F.Ca.IN.020.03.2.1]RUV00543.1 hypothetical protein EOA79_20280 [Mesorhizobium sp. M1A.F.Ca.IN.020.03.2.1]
MNAITPIDSLARRAIEDEIERLISLLDLMEADCDLEDGADDEPSLGWCTGYGPGDTLDLEADDCDDEDDGTAEPSPGALNRVCQVKWAAGARSDREADAGDIAEVPAYGE